jgi:hypothetical protein
VSGYSWSAGSGRDFVSQSKVMNRRWIGEGRSNEYCNIRCCICDESEDELFWIFVEKQSEDNELSIRNQ